jgi:hypothetical protein
LAIWQVFISDWIFRTADGNASVVIESRPINEKEVVFEDI